MVDESIDHENDTICNAMHMHAFSFDYFGMENKGGQTRGVMLQGHVAATCCSDKNLCSTH